MTASNSSDYTLSGTDRNGNISGSDPNLTFSDTISFVVNASGNPFYLKTTAGTGTGNTISGLTNNGKEYDKHNVYMVLAIFRTCFRKPSLQIKENKG